MNPNPDYKLKLVNRLLILALFVLSFGFWIFVSKIQDQLDRTSYQINSLTDQLGTVKEENFFMKESLNQNKDLLTSLGEDFDQMGDAIDEVEELKKVDDLLDESQDSIQKSSESTLVMPKTDEILKSEPSDDYFVVLLIGAHDGLTDTLMVAIVNEETQEIVLVSVPRDLYINGSKINAYNNFFGIEQTLRMVELVIGFQIDRYAYMDLDGFVNLVDALDGIDVCLKQDLYDPYYPTSSYGYETLSVAAGCQHFDGTMALKIARSRETTSDFDRAERQQLIVQAIYEKILQLDSVMDLSEMTSFFETVSPYVKTDIDLTEGLSYYLKYKDYEIKPALVLSSGNYLYSTTNYYGSYILLPRAGDYSVIWGEVQSLLEP